MPLVFMGRLLERMLRFQRGDVPRGLLLFAYLFLVLAAYVVGQVARDALFLGRFAASRLPFADLTLFLLVTVVIGLYVRAGRRLALDRLLAGSLVLFGGVALLLAILARGFPAAWVFPVVYVWVGIYGVLAPAQVWTLANYVLTPREARRLFGFIGAGATLGATAGGILSSALAHRAGALSLLVVMSALLLLATLPVQALWRLRPRLAEDAGAAPEGRPGLRASLQLVLDSPHLRAIAGVVLISSFVTSVTGWQFKAMAQQALVTQNSLAAFFGGFNASVGALCVVTQLLLTAGLLRRFGLGPVLFLLPACLLFGSMGLLASGTLAAAVLLKGADKVLRYSIDRPAVELLYLPVPPGLKLSAKSFIDTVAWRAGDGLAGLAVLAFVTLGGMGPVHLALVVLPFVGLWLVLASRVHRRYVTTLGEGLRQHRLDAERAAPVTLDKGTTEVIAARLEAVDPGEILYALDLLAVGQGVATHPAVRGLLGHGDPEVRRRALEILNEAGDGSVVSQVEALLRDPHLAVRTEALLYLSRHADVDPLARLGDLEDYPDFSVRAAVVSVLARLGGERLEAAQPLFESMAGEDGKAGRRTRLEAARLAERQPLPFTAALQRLMADEDEEVARTAIRAAARHGAGPFVDTLVARLGEPSVAMDATDALIAAGSAALVPVSRTLADRGATCVARRAIPSVLERIGTDEAVAVLTDHLTDGDATLRLRILVALVGIRDQRGEVPIDPRALEAALGAEILGHYRSYQILGQVGAGDPGTEPVAQGLRTAMRQELERIFRLLDLMHYGRGFRSAWVALQSGNAIIHDQALDLLESALRPEVRALLVPLVDPEVTEDERVRLAHRLVGAPMDTPEGAVAALASTGDPWLRSCAAYAIGALGLRAFAPELDAWSAEPDPLLREAVRQAKVKLAEGGDRA
jgi:AAA family ATP:ADP antiporter